MAFGRSATGPRMTGPFVPARPASAAGMLGREALAGARWRPAVHRTLALRRR